MYSIFLLERIFHAFRGAKPGPGPLLTTGGAFPRRGAALVLALATLVLLGAAALRSTEYDENYSVFVTGGVARPAWPDTAFTPAEARQPFVAHAGPRTIARLIRDTDVHPPLYFWTLGAWRRVAGDGLLAQRGLSVLFTLGALAAWMTAAWRAGLPPLAMGLMTALAYGFGYTGHIARGFALAHLLIALAALAAVEALRRMRSERGRSADGLASAAGLAGGLAAFTNYLAVFPAAGVLAALVLGTGAPSPGRTSRLRVALAAGLPFLVLLLGSLYFFLAQKGTRTDQFDPFAARRVLSLLAQYNAANLLGGLALYLHGVERWALGALLALLPAGAALAVVLRWRALGPTRRLWLFGFLAPSLGLFALGAVFGSTPVELRYLAFAAPFAAALAAGAAASWAGPAPRAAGAGLGLLLAIQAAGTLGMMLHPASQQPYRGMLAALAPQLGPGTALLVPFGNDGVGVVGSTLREAPPGQPVLVLRGEDAPEAPPRLAGFRRAVVLGAADRDGIAQAQRAVEALRGDPGWADRGTLWRDPRRGFAVEAFERSGGPADESGSEPVAAGP